MKIEFNGETQVQGAVRPAQGRMKQAKAPRLPIMQILITLAIFGAIGYGGYRFYYMKSIHTYGVVSSQTEKILAPREGIISNLTIARGKSISAGAPIMTISPTMTTDQAAAQTRVLEEIQKSDSVRNLQRDTTVALAEREVDRIQRLGVEELAKRDADFELAKLETLKLKEFLAQKEKRLAKLKELFALDAAIQSDIDAAENEVQLARRTYQQASISEGLAKSRALPSSGALEAAKIQLEAARKSPDVNTADLERAKFELDLSKDKQVPVNIESPLNGLVLELEVVNGSLVREGETLASIVQTDNVWVDVFVPSRQFNLISEGDEAKVYIPGSPDPIIGHVSEKLGAVVRPPEILRDDLPRQTTTLYARVELPEGQLLLPGLEVRVVIE